MGGGEQHIKKVTEGDLKFANGGKNGEEMCADLTNDLVRIHMEKVQSELLYQR